MPRAKVPPYGSDTNPNKARAADYQGAVDERKRALDALAKMQAERPLKPPRRA